MTNELARRSAIAGFTALALLGGPTTTVSAAEPGRIVGHVTKSTGEPAAGMWVTAEGVDPGVPTPPDQHGAYVISNVTTSSDIRYRVRVEDVRHGRQWAHQRTTPEAADTFVVVSGQDTVVDDVLFPTGSLAVTATDASTGVGLQSFCATVLGPPGGIQSCTTSGQLLFTDLRPGQWTAETTGDDFHGNGSSPAVAVVAGQTAAADIRLKPAGVVTAVTVDATTREPVANACVNAVATDQPVQIGYRCSDAASRSRLDDLCEGQWS